MDGRGGGEEVGRRGAREPHACKTAHRTVVVGPSGSQNLLHGGPPGHGGAREVALGCDRKPQRSHTHSHVPNNTRASARGCRQHATRRWRVPRSRSSVRRCTQQAWEQGTTVAGWEGAHRKNNTSERTRLQAARHTSLGVPRSRSSVRRGHRMHTASMGAGDDPPMGVGLDGAQGDSGARAQPARGRAEALEGGPALVQCREHGSRAAIAQWTRTLW
jgi:hypothetical protein